MGEQTNLLDEIARAEGTFDMEDDRKLIIARNVEYWGDPWKSLFYKLLPDHGWEYANKIVLSERYFSRREARYEHNMTANVNNKLGMYEGLVKGLFGNRQVIYPVEVAEVWFENQFVPGAYVPFDLWALRYKVPGHRQWSCYDLPPESVWPTYCDWVAEGADPNLFNLTPMMPDHKIVVQGEISRSEQFGWIFRVSHMKRPMNISLGEDQHHHEGPGYWLYLKSVMDPSSYNDIQELFERYPNATIEFSTYSIKVGDCPGRNTLIWEVRNY